MKEKTRRAILVVEWFIPDIDWQICITDPFLKQSTLGLVGLKDVIEDPDGMSADEAFIFKSSHGKSPEKCKDLARLAALMWGQRWMATQIKVWKEAMAQAKRDKSRIHYIHSGDFKDEPKYIKELYWKTWCNPVLSEKQ